MDRLRDAVGLQVVSLLMMIAFAVVSARWLGPSGKGALALVVAAGALGSVVLGLGIPQALTTWVARGRLTLTDALVGGSAWGALITILLAAGGMAYQSSDIVVRFLWLAIGAVAFEQVMSSVAVGAGDLFPPLLSRLLGGGSQVAYMLAGLALGWRPTISTVVIFYYVLALLGIVVAGAFLILRARKTGSPSISRMRVVVGEAPQVLRFGLKLMPAHILAMANSRVDILFLGWLAGSAAVGIYSLAVSATLLVGMIPAAVGQALTSTFGSDVEPAHQLRRGVHASLVLASVTAFVIAVSAPYLVPLVFGREFADAARLIMVMAPFTALFSLNQVTYPYFCNHLRRPFMPSVVTGVTAVLDILLVSLLARRYGADGAAIASAVAYGVGAVVNLSVTARGAGISIVSLILPNADDMVWMFERGKALLGRTGRA